MGCLVVPQETSRETWLLHEKMDSHRDAFLLHLCCLYRGLWCQNICLFAVKFDMDAAGCNHLEELGFSLRMCQPRLAVRSFCILLLAEDSTGATR